MKEKILAILITGALVLPAVTSLFDLEARRRGGATIVVSTFSVSQTTISPN